MGYDSKKAEELSVMKYGKSFKMNLKKVRRLVIGRSPYLWVLAVMGSLTTAAQIVQAEQPKIGWVQDLTAGDRACYVTITDSQNIVTTELAGFDICEQDLVGKQVRFTYEIGNVVAEECNGDLDCGLSDTVSLIREATVLPRPLPFLSTAEIETLKISVVDGANSWFGLAGLNKVDHPPAISEELVSYRQRWQKIDPAIAPFLGVWRNDEYANNRYTLNIFPSQSRTHVCVVAFKLEWSLSLWDETTQDYSIKDVISEGIFSISLGNAGSAQLRSSEIRLSELAIAQAPFDLFEDHNVELISMLVGQNNTRTLAAAGLPLVPSDLSEEQNLAVKQAIADYGCIID
ncbi:MAG: hypothetical protein HC799_12865 [Limnothrix sp. RL_2_0]|nr:hypothetical protein [Limnothrix sp. RL_2_0]